MKKNFNRHYLIFCLIFAFWGCAASSKLPNLSSISPEYIRAKVQQNSGKLENFAGKARVIIEIPGQGYNGFSDIYLKMPDSLMIKTEAILGIDIGLLFMNQKYFAAFAPKENTLYYGEREILNLRDFLQVEMDTDELYEVVTGFVKIPVNEASHLEIDDGKILLRSPTPDGELLCWVDPRHYVVVKSKLINPEGKTLLVKEFRRFKKSKGIILPRTIRLTRPLTRERITVYYTKQEINKPIPSSNFKLKIPKNAKRIYWGDLKHPRLDRQRIQKQTSP